MFYSAGILGGSQLKGSDEVVTETTETGGANKRNRYGTQPWDCSPEQRGTRGVREWAMRVVGLAENDVREEVGELLLSTWRRSNIPGFDGFP